MSYLSSAALAADPIFQKRMSSATTEQAAIYQNDARPEFIQLADNILRNPQAALTQFCVQASVQPGFNEAESQDAIDDGQILSAVQAIYPTIAGVNYIAPSEETEDE